MIHRRAVLAEEAFDLVQSGWRNGFENAEAESLSNGRVHAIKRRISARALNPLGAAFGKDAGPRFDKFNAGMRFGALKSPRESQVAERHYDAFAFFDDQYQ